MKFLKCYQFLLGLVLLAATSCENETAVPNLRSELSYNDLNTNESYSTQFLDQSGTSTVDLTEGNISLSMFQSMDNYIKSSVSTNSRIDQGLLSNLFNNTESSYSQIEIKGGLFNASDLNNSEESISARVAPSRSQAEILATQAYFESLFEEIDANSLSINEEASINQAGKLGNYLLNNKGIEVAQVIQKSLLGAFQLDYIGNVLLNSGLNADNSTLVSDRNYTQLEHNWDLAYATLTLNPIYLEGFSDTEKGSVSEFGAGAYIWEYNKSGYAKIYPAFLKGRAAIVNNDLVEMENQALVIRQEFEKSIANAALGYLGKWRTSTTEDKRAHAIGEALGFIYSLRFASTYQADANFSDTIIAALINSENGFWDIDAAKINTAEAAIKSKFNL
ncbi:DUF4856 domain-containing protein [Algoriphagus lutimaris]|uniref:DUF4856 domain-containing protein n=1 Tax=Algoriphagus lutimaris TaxID=613197 RepID=UPI00196B6961|nr:DUF4856 domain-containing protein [Algoriphagus lutimaris]MBN3518808.1 DUF4856 domain-containing protein [Algoriphagus lutimaris]